MAKRGGTKHLKRIAIERSVPITTKKSYVWITQPASGPHTKKESVPLGVLLRDVLGVAQTAKEVRGILNSRLVQVNGTVRTKSDFPVGLMDIVSFPKAGTHYQIVVGSKGRLYPKDASADALSKKLLKVVGKNTLPKGKIAVTLHDGRNIIADNNVFVGDTVIFDATKKKIQKVIKLEVGARCLVTEGKHAGSVAVVKEIIERKEGRGAEAKLETADDGEFITIAEYLFVVDDSFTGIGGNNGQ